MLTLIELSSKIIIKLNAHLALTDIIRNYGAPWCSLRKTVAVIIPTVCTCNGVYES